MFFFTLFFVSFLCKINKFFILQRTISKICVDLLSGLVFFFLSFLLIGLNNALNLINFNFCLTKKNQLESFLIYFQFFSLISRINSKTSSSLPGSTIVSSFKNGTSIRQSSTITNICYVLW